jgi:hypothetical protein
MHAERKSVIIIKLINGLLNFITRVCRLGRNTPPVRGRIEIIKLLRTVHHGILPHLTTVIVDEGVFHYCENPGLQIRGIHKFILVLYGF